MTASCYFSKWPELIPLREKTGKSVANALFKLFTRYGCPEVIISDQGREFNNQIEKRLMELTGVHHRVTSAYHPQANGLVEKQNSTTTQCLKACIETQEDWLPCLDSLAMSFRASQHTSTGKTPYEMVYGKRMLLPADLTLKLKARERAEARRQAGEAVPDDDDDDDQYPVPTQQEVFETAEKMRKAIHDAAVINIDNAQIKQCKDYDIRHLGSLLKVGDQVMWYNKREKDRKGNKLAFDWKGPYTVVEISKNKNYTLADVNGKILPNKAVAKFLKKYIDGYTQPSQKPDSNQDFMDNMDTGKIVRLFDCLVINGLLEYENRKNRTLTYTSPYFVH